LTKVVIECKIVPTFNKLLGFNYGFSYTHKW